MKSNFKNMKKKIMAGMILACVVIIVMPTVSAGAMGGVGSQNYRTDVEAGVINIPKIKQIESMSYVKPLESIEPLSIQESHKILLVSMPKMPSIPKISSITDTISSNQMNNMERDLIRSIPDPAMQYNSIEFAEALLNYHDGAMKVGSIVTGTIPLTSLLGVVGVNLPIDNPLKPQIDLDPLSIGLNFAGNSLKNELSIMKQEVLEPQTFTRSYEFGDKWTRYQGTINLMQQWSPGEDFDKSILDGTMRREISHISKISTPNLNSIPTYQPPRINSQSSLNSIPRYTSPSFTNF